MPADDGRHFDMPEIRGGDLRRDPPIVMLEEVGTLADDRSLQVAVEVAVDRPYAAQGRVDELPVTRAEDFDEDVGEPVEVVATPPAPAFAASTPVAVQWPPERQDRILWLRVVAPNGGRMAGRTLRQALNACGLAHGPQDIFHWADDSGRVIASAANLVRPGSFDPLMMDTQEFPGVHLFAVLPGPLSPVQTWDELLSLARDVAARVGGIVQDDGGRVVDAEIAAAQRVTLLPEGEEPRA
jgi:cell division protein ZipA